MAVTKDTLQLTEMEYLYWGLSLDILRFKKYNYFRCSTI